MLKRYGRFRIGPLTVRDLPQVDQQYNRIFNTYLTRYLTRYVRLRRDEPTIYGPSNRRYCLGGFAGTKVVAHAAARPGRLTIEGTLIPWASYGNVFTDPAYRNRGIASRINRRIWDRLRRDGTEGVYISGDRGLYTRMGAALSGDYFDFVYEAGRWRAALKWSRPLAARRCRREDGSVLVRLHARERAGFLRTEEDFGPLLAYGIANHRRAAAWLIMERGTPVAYVVVGLYGAGRNLKGSVIDYAGSRAALMSGLPVLVRQAGLRTLEISAGGWDGELLWMLRSLGRAGTWSGVPGTHLILNPPRLVRRLFPYIARRVGIAAARRLRFRASPRGAFEFAYRSRRHRCPDLPSLTRLLLGDRPDRWEKGLPRRGDLRDTLKGIFPLPFPVIGLNWM